MEFNFTFKGMESSPAITQYAEKKLAKLERYFYGQVHAQVIFRREKFREMVEVILTGDGENLIVKEETDDIYSSIDFAYESLEKQVKKLKEKRKDKRLGRNQVIKESSGPSLDIIIKEVEIHPMSTQEAYEFFKQSKENIYLFYNTDYDKVCCLYRADTQKMMLIPVIS